MLNLFKKPQKKEGNQKSWWERHIAADFSESGHDPRCFDCKEGNDACMKSLRCQVYNEDEWNFHKKV